MKQSLLRSWLLSSFLAMACVSTLLLDSVQAQTWRGTYCIAWDRTITPTRVVWSTSVRGGQTYQIALPDPTTPQSVQYLAVSWGTDMNMPDTVCTWRVIPVQTVISVPNSAQLWELQLIEIDVVEIGPGVQGRSDMREIVIPGSVQRALTWSLTSDIILWIIAIPLGAYLGREWVWSIRRMVRGWFETAQSGDDEWERYNEAHGIYYDETEREFRRVAHRE